MVIWTKTDAGRAEIQARALVKERAQRNLLLVIDGRKSDEMLLDHLAGISTQDFTTLESLGLIVRAGQPPAGAAGESASGASGATAATGAAGAVAPPRPKTAVPAPASQPGATAPVQTAAVSASDPLDYAQFTAVLTQIISKELGLRGFMLTLAVEKASTAEELRAVADRTLVQVRDRRGEASAAAAGRALFGV